jgi:hypothetical protein
MPFHDLIERLGLMRNDLRGPADSMREIAKIEQVAARRYRQVAFGGAPGFRSDLFGEGPSSMPLQAEAYWLQRWILIARALGTEFPDRLPPRFADQKATGAAENVLLAPYPPARWKQRIDDDVTVLQLLDELASREVNETPPAMERSAPMSKAEMARRLTGRPKARGRDIEPFLRDHDLQHAEGHNWTVRLDTMDQRSREKLEQQT